MLFLKIKDKIRFSRASSSAWKISHEQSNHINLKLPDSLTFRTLYKNINARWGWLTKACLGENELLLDLLQVSQGYSITGVPGLDKSESKADELQISEGYPITGAPGLDKSESKADNSEGH